jgi:hypothetical protein
MPQLSGNEPILGLNTSQCTSWSIHTGAFPNINHWYLHYTKRTRRVLKYWGTGAFMQNNASMLY